MKKRLVLFAVLAGSFLSTYGDETHHEILGYIEPYRNIDMTAAESGLIAEIHVEEGSRIKAGDPVISLESGVLQAQLKVAQIQASSTASIDIATADHEVARDRHIKMGRLQDRKSAHTTEVIKAKAELKKSEGRIQMAKEEKNIAEFRVKEIEAQIERRILRSPIDGVVLEINGDVAESATPAGQGGEQEALARIARLDKLRLVVHLPADLIGDLKTGDEIGVLVLNRSSLQTDRKTTGIKTTGKVEFISPAKDPSSETVRTRIVINNEDGKLQSGSHAYALLPPVAIQ